MKIKKSIAAGLALAAVIATPTLAAPPVQARVEAMIARVQQLAVLQLETVLTSHAGRPARIIYVKKFPGQFEESRYCGTALIGSQSKRFIVDMSEQITVTDPSQRVWTEASCETNPANTTILRDLR